MGQKRHSEALGTFLGGLNCNPNQEAGDQAALAEACKAIDDANRLQRQQMAWEIVQHQHLSIIWTSEQMTAEVNRVAENLK